DPGPVPFFQGQGQGMATIQKSLDTRRRNRLVAPPGKRFRQAALEEIGGAAALLPQPEGETPPLGRSQRPRPFRASVGEAGGQQQDGVGIGVHQDLLVVDARAPGETGPLPWRRSSAAITVNVQPESTMSSTRSTGPAGIWPVTSNTPSRLRQRW